MTDVISEKLALDKMRDSALERMVLEKEQGYVWCPYCNGRGWVSNGDGTIGCFACTNKKGRKKE